MSFLKQLKKRNQKLFHLETDCKQPIIKQSISKNNCFDILHHNIILKKHFQIKEISKLTKYNTKIKIGCNLKDKIYSLSELLSENKNIFYINGIKYARMFHGTTEQNLNLLLEQGIKPIGGGVLGNGFYMTPSLEKALIYTSKLEFSSDFKPMIIEIWIKNPDSVTCCCLDKKDLCCKDFIPDLITDFDDEIWQFCIKDIHFIKSHLYYNFWLLI